MGFCYSIGIRLINFIIFFFLIVLLPGLPPRTHFDIKSFDIKKPRELKGSLELNTLLDNAERLFEGKIHGPEHLLARANDIYTGIHGGEVIKINGHHITHVAKFGEPCEHSFEESKCGRPLGMAFDTLGNNLIVADAYYGIWSVDLNNGKKKLLISPHQEIDGKITRKAALFNSVAVHSTGDIFWTDSSSDFGIDNGVYSLLANPSGRLLRYNRETNTSKVLIDEINFANGLALSPKEDYILLSETASSQIRRYYLTGAKSGTWDIFIDSLPGFTDNLTPDAEGIWVPLVMSVDENNPSITQSAAKVPLIRTFLLRLFALMELPFKVIENVFPNQYSKRALYFLGHFESIRFVFPKRTTLVRLDWNGNIVGSLHGFDKSVTSVSHVLELNGYLYLGSPMNTYVGRVKLPKEPKVRVVEMNETPQKELPKAKPTEAPKPKPTEAPKVKPTEAPKVVKQTEAPKPTTTPPPPPPVQKTTEAPKPKPTEAPKPKPTEAPKVVKPTEAPKVAKPTDAPKVKATEAPKEKPKDPAPIRETIPTDTKPPTQEKIKIIKKSGEQGEL